MELELCHSLTVTFAYIIAGIRCDSDLYTYGFPWNPWTEKQALAKGPAILEYIKQTCQQDGIDKHILFDRKVKDLSWSSKTQSWSTEVANGENVKTMRSKYVFLATGYFDYDQGLEAIIPGIKNFAGEVLHPQFWPESFDYTDKDVVIVGSGATAISLLPAMAGKAKHVTMLQRSPSYIMSIPLEGDWIERMIRAVAPAWLATRLVRLKWIVLPAIFRTYCTMFPARARRMMRRITEPQLKQADMMDPHFNPRYNPFEQRMCMCPDGDFYDCLRGDDASIKTGVIEQVTTDSIKLESGDELHPDVIVTATGLKLRLGGNINISIDGGAPLQMNDQFVWKGLMFEQVPNLFFSFGYLDASWTLGVDTSAQLACRVLSQMKKDGSGVVFAQRNEKELATMKELSIMPLTSTYVKKARAGLPKVGNSAPWKPRQPYLWEQMSLKWGDNLAGLEWVRDNR
ncbi:hypothetical protein SLS59_003258 [Nothophoma quercina]|uniref:Monooxygenase n=1 Tax=Nothophoma quercina TaxID=749835 RepID=A0ABR3RPK1_9PLEO